MIWFDPMKYVIYVLSAIVFVAAYFSSRRLISMELEYRNQYLGSISGKERKNWIRNRNTKIFLLVIAVILVICMIIVFGLGMMLIKIR